MKVTAGVKIVHLPQDWLSRFKTWVRNVEQEKSPIRNDTDMVPTLSFQGTNMAP